MNDTDALERAFQRVRELPPEHRERFRLVLDEMLQQDDLSARDMEDPEYRAYVEQALAGAEEDYRAGRYKPLDKAFDEIRGDFKKRHGV